MSPSAAAARLSTDNMLVALPEVLIGRILFSGYLPTTWTCTIGLMLVCKKFEELGHTYIAIINNRDRFVYHTKTQRPVLLSVLGIEKIARNLVYLDMSFCTNIDYSDEKVANVLRQLKTTLRGLSMRGSRVTDAFLVAAVAELTNLRYLNISQSARADKELVTDIGGLALRELKHLKWLNMSMTLITDETIIALQRSCPQMEHVDLYGCARLTDEALQALALWKLQELDISNNPRFTLQGIKSLCVPSAPIFHTLQALSCGFWPGVLVSLTLPVLLALPKLKKLDIRRSTLQPQTEKLEKEARAKLEKLFLTHTDMVKKGNIIQDEPSRRSLCPVLRWPYNAADL